MKHSFPDVVSPSNFGPPNIQRVMSYHSYKRQRDHEELAGYNNGDLFREKKKHRPLPLRASPRARQQSNFVRAQEPAPQVAVPALTPIESSDDEDQFTKQLRSGPGPSRVHPLLQQPHIPRLASETPMDMDTFDDARTTTMADTFPQRAVHSASVTKNTESSTGSIPRNFQDIPWWRSPRLPSPVSDTGDAITSSKDTPDDVEMVYDVSRPESPPSWTSTAMEAEAADVRERLSSLDIPDQGHTDPDSSVRTGKKLAFSMGYRADCDKCQRRVPGHYSHIIRS